MNKLSYTLHKTGVVSEKKKTSYLHGDLIKMTTYQLREICYRECLIKNTLTSLNREELVRLVMRYRGKKETLWIRDFQEEGLEKVESFLQKVKIQEVLDHDIRIPAKLLIYDGVDLDYFDRCYLKTKEVLEEGNLLLTDDENRIYSIFNLEKTPDNIYFITKHHEVPVKEVFGRQYSIIYVEGHHSDFLYDLYYGNITSIPTSIQIRRIPIIDFHMEQIVESDVPLVIDFGSSNTTVGIFDKQQEYKLVNVLNKSNKHWEEVSIIPSVIGIKEIQEETVDYVFGYEAMQISKNNYLDEELPVFYDIKRWINDASRREKVMSATGAYTWLLRSDLLKVYLEYIIKLSSQRFKRSFRKIQILSPVRQREKFKRVFQNLLWDYEVECTLDEGVAVLFHSIRNLIQSNQYERNHWYKALIIDCGGGTTDLTSSNFKIDNNRVSYQIALECSYENGDTNFGGNNLTYRIMQLLKIRLTEQLTGTVKTVGMQCLKANNFRFIDKNGVGKVYEELNAAYEEAEMIIPTKFLEYEQTGAQEYFKVKNNYFYLFELAEKIKKIFFADEEFYELMISWKQNLDEKENNRRAVLFLDKWKISMKKGDAFLNVVPTGELLFYLYEMKALLMADVYNLVKKFMERDFEKGELGKYELIKLTGQSCQAGLFIEALKEYIPGKILQGSRKQRDPYELKVCCLSGALFYFQNKRMGYMDITNSYEAGALPYEVIAYTHEKYETTLIASLQKKEHTGHISRFMEGEQIEIYLRDTDGGLLKSYLYNYITDELKSTTFEEIEVHYPGKIIQDETDNIINGESKFFVWVSKDEWGFYILPVLRKQEALYRGEAAFFDFEDDTWEQNYFDGRK